MSIIPFERLSCMKEAGLSPKDIKVIEDLATMLMPMSRQFDVVDEAVRRWKQVKAMAAEKARQQDAVNKAKAERSASIFRHGGIESMADGKIYSDASAYRRALNAQGYIEVGNEDTTKEGHRTRQNINKHRRKAQETDINSAVAQALKDVRI